MWKLKINWRGKNSKFSILNAKLILLENIPRCHNQFYTSGMNLVSSKRGTKQAYLELNFVTAEPNTII